MKKKDQQARWLVAVKLPKAKALWMKTRGFNKNEIFGFPTKKDAKDFIFDVTPHGVECLIAKA